MSDHRDGGTDATSGDPLDDTFKALSEPRRRAILRLVADRELAAGEIASAFDVTRPAISQHLSTLRSAGLVTERRDGTRRLYRAAPDGLEGLRRFLDELWGDALDRARLIAEQDAGVADDGAGRDAG